jgi:diguanylate cyclase (GGDEF)-like protein
MARSLPRLLRGLVAEHRFRRALRSVYTRGRHLETNDSLTGLYSRGFLMAHLDRARQDMAATGEPFAVCALSVPDLAGINAAHGYAGGDRVLRQVGAMIGRLSRAEDLAARCGCHMVLVMPGTDADAALAPSRRIAGVVRATDLGLPDGGRLRVDLAERLVALDPDEATDDLMRRLLASPSP